jgi:hypothetical protein
VGRVRSVMTRTSLNLEAIVLIQAYTLLPMESLLPLKLQKTVAKLRSLKQSLPTRELVKCKRKIYLNKRSFERGSVFEVTFMDTDIIRLEKFGETFFINHSSFKELFDIDDGDYINLWIKQQTAKERRVRHRKRRPVLEEALNFEDPHDD